MRSAAGEASVGTLDKSETTISPFFGCFDVWKTFPGRGRAVLPGVSIEVPRGGILALIGASGCGKTTLLNILAGFEAPDAGEVRLEGKICCRPGPDRAVVFQEPALFPWLTALENVELGLEARGLPPRLRREQALAMLGQTGLDGYGERLPVELSGGQRQRVALARALALSPAVILMDEPFAALDAITREQMQRLLVGLHASTMMSIVLVTHDVEEALLLADEIAVLSPEKGIVAARRVSKPRRERVDPGLLEELRAILRATLMRED